MRALDTWTGGDNPYFRSTSVTIAGFITNGLCWKSDATLDVLVRVFGFAKRPEPFQSSVDRFVGGSNH